MEFNKIASKNTSLIHTHTHQSIKKYIFNIYKHTPINEILKDKIKLKKIFNL
jgi:hypothetical protein